MRRSSCAGLPSRFEAGPESGPAGGAVRLRRAQRTPALRALGPRMAFPPGLKAGIPCEDQGMDGSLDGPTDDGARLLVIVDAANVVGSVPDGWWRDRRGAAERLRDRLAADGLPGHSGLEEIVLVVEGAARGVEPVPGVRVEAASGSGDDRIVELVAEAGGRSRLVVTADRELRRRVTELGADVTGPRSVRG